MPDITYEASAKYWFEYVDPMIYRIVTFMESVEEWTLDGNVQLEEAMAELGRTLDDISTVDLDKLGRQADFMQLVANIKTGRGLRLLQALDTVHPGSASKIIMHAEQTASGTGEPADIFLKRNLVFERLRLLSRMFCVYRLKLVARALEGEE